ncbi:FG-GAP repeat protein [Salinibacter altiplanensis]|uniref:FG-GAP repeat protein n=1 Tax=Salinibacter altiplanensis TaxID=1803181 RepID=UPI001F278027|nr:FG-GAP repeat protein [Salinibacter altiplanensis]
MLRPHLLLCLGLLFGLVPTEGHAQIEALPRPDTLQSASFGVSVAIDDSIAVIGASGASVCGEDAGAVFVYERQPGPPVTSWALTARLVPTPCRADAFFGADVALSGSRVLVSASSEHFGGEGENAAYMFKRSADSTWQQTARLTGAPDRREGLFAAGVALDGDRAAVSTSGNPNRNDPERRYGGAVYVFEHDADPDGWTRTARLRSDDRLDSGLIGGDVVLDGPHLAVAASTFFEREPGSVYVFRHDPSSKRWREDAHLRDIDAFFISLDLHGSILLVGEGRARDDNSGAATVYTRDDTSWRQTTTLRPSIPYESGSFGATVALHDRRALITGYDEQLGNEINIDRVVYVFRRRPEGSWRERTVLDIGSVDFGASLDLDGPITLVGTVAGDESGTAHIARIP